MKLKKKHINKKRLESTRLICQTRDPGNETKITSYKAKKK
jgi:hypothetical protein